MALSSTASYPELLLVAQAERMRYTCGVLETSFDEGSDALDTTLACLEPLVARIYRTRDDAELWLVLTALSGAFPHDRDLEHAVAYRDEHGAEQFFDWVISVAAIASNAGGSSLLPMRVITDRPVVDVSSCATSNRHTGIQRVEREMIPLWEQSRVMQLVAWNDRDGSYRSLSEAERRRVLGWGGSAPGSAESVSSDPEFLVPWRTTVVLPEVPNHDKSGRLRGLARFSGNKVTAIGYDLIPLMSPDLLPRDLGADFLDYLGVIKYSRAVAGISRSATEEYRSFLRAVGMADTAEARVVSVELPTSVPDEERAKPRVSGTVPVVVCVGSHEPRKNHGSVLHAAEKLWRAGLAFELEFLGGGGWGTDFDVNVRRLEKLGRAVHVRKAVSDEALWDAYRRASFTVFPSLHEGFGLPVAESLAFGVPVVTTQYGSTREIADLGGCIVVDPRSDDEVFEAMSTMLTDDAVRQKLAAEARAIPLRSWAQYADELWKALIDDVA
jgi:glycosyltransferase involved in cell wall biosynthesis